MIFFIPVNASIGASYESFYTGYRINIKSFSHTYKAFLPKQTFNIGFGIDIKSSTLFKSLVSILVR